MATQSAESEDFQTHFLRQADAVIDVMFRDICYLDAGSFGTIFQATHITTNKLQCIKKIKKNNSARNEIFMLQQIKHPNIVQYSTSWQQHGMYFIVIELADGG